MLLVEREAKRLGIVNVVNGQLVLSAASDEMRKWMKLELDGLRLLPLARRAKLLGPYEDAQHRISQAFAVDEEKHG